MTTKMILMSLAAASILLMTGCAQPAQSGVAQGAPAQISLEFDGAPTWVLDPTVEGAMCAAGSAKIGPACLNLAITEATSNGRDDLSRQIKTNVASMVKNFTQATGAEGLAVDKVMTAASKQLANQDLSGSKGTKKWISKTGTVWVLVVMQDPSKVSASIKEIVKSSFKNDEALWQQFQGKKAQDELDASLEKLTAKPAV